jgi:uncharacterized membrane protein
LPIIFGVIRWDSLPDTITTHFGADGTPDGASSKAFAVFGLPLIMLAFPWLCVIATFLTNRKREQSDKVYTLLFFIMPVLSTFISVLIYATALDFNLNLGSILSILSGLMFVVMGNYMPKVTRNRTMGIKIKWTLANDENWNATHRFAGKVYVIIGFICLLTIPLPEKVFPFVMIGVILACALTPVVYSYIFYRKQLAIGSVSKDEYKQEYSKMFGKSKAAVVISLVLTAIILAGVAVLMFVGDIKAVCTDDSFDVKASFSEDFSVKYEDIDSVEYREGGVDGQRIYGFASARLLMGNFKNKEFGNYTRYTYAKDLPCIVLKIDERVVVIGTDNAEATKEIYDTLTSKISK